MAARDEIAAAVAAEQPATEQLLADLVKAPTLLGSETAGQEIMYAAFAELGLEPQRMPLDPEALRTHAGASPFSWDLDGKFNVVANWNPTHPPSHPRASTRAPAGGR